MLNKRTNCVEKSVHVIFDEFSIMFKTNMKDESETDEHAQEQITSLLQLLNKM